jgi:glutamate-1-semialdehyde 2,1-aminomutase
MPVSATPLPVPFPPRSRAPWAAPAFDVAEEAPPQMVQAIGARVWSADGAEYIDFDNAGGAVILGHRDPSVIAAVRLARSSDERRGLERYKADVAERIQHMAPGAEATAFGADVSQVMRAALTTARLYTGRELVFACGSAVRAPPFRFDDLPALERLLDQDGKQTAALVLAPCGDHTPSARYLPAVRALCDRHGVVLIFDEALSGFRVHEGGAQALYGVEADLVVFGENLANGMPLGALIGRRDLVETAQTSEHLGADIASLAAAKAVLTRLDSDPVIATLRIGGAEIQAEVDNRIRAAGLEGAVAIEGDPAALRLAFHPAALGLAEGDALAMKSLWTNECLAHRLFTLGAVNMSYAHGDREIAVLLTACEQAAERLALALRQASASPRLPAAPGCPS